MENHRCATKQDIIDIGLEDNGGVAFHNIAKGGKKYIRRPRFVNGRVLVSIDGADKALQIREPGSILYVSGRVEKADKKVPYATGLRPDHVTYLKSLDNASAWLENILNHCVPPAGDSG